MATELTVTERASAVLSFDETKAALLPLVEASARIVSITNSAGYAEAQSARVKLKTTRVEIEKRGKAAREDATAFSKAVIAKEKELVAVIGPEEDRLQALQDEWDAAIAREKAAKAEAERLRVFHIRQHIETLRAMPLRALGANAALIAEVLDMASEPLTFDAQEFAAEALAAQADAVAALTTALDAAKADEIRREAEAARIAAERAELARLRAEQEKRDAEERAKIDAEREAARRAQAEADRIAAEERERIAAVERAKHAEELRMQRAAEEQARAERMAAEAAERAERDRIAAEAAERQRAEDERIRREREHLEQAKAEQERIARQRELDAATLIDAATEAHAFLDARFPAEFVTLKLGVALARECKKPARKAAA